jgi:hypothetical protein
MSNESKAHDSRNEKGRGHEERDVAFQYVTGAGIGLAVMILVALLSMSWLFDFYCARDPLEPGINLLDVAGAFTEPRLQTKLVEQLRRLVGRELDTGTYV